MPDIAFLAAAFVTLFVIIDPIGLAPLFIPLSAGMDARQRRSVGLRACIIAAALLAIFGFAGETILTTIGITMPAFQISGGILLFLTALDMLFDRRQPRREEHTNQVAHDPSVFPLAMPLIAGPGGDDLDDPADEPDRGLGRGAGGATGDAGGGCRRASASSCWPRRSSGCWAAPARWW